MTKLAAKLQTLRSREEGATAVEYGIMVVLIAAVIVVIVGTLGQQVLDGFTSVSNEMPAPAP